MSPAGASSSPAPPEEPSNAAKDTPGSSNQSHEDNTSSESSSKPSGWLQRTHQVWLQGKGMLLVLLAQFFGATMNVMARLLERDGPHGKGMTPFHILLARMPATTIFSFIYMWYMKVPEPFGARAVRPLLILRGISGFIGVLSLYYSLIYLPLSEATVLTFLSSHAVGAGLVGVMGATSAYTLIRKIGPRAHPLVSVNYFSLLTSVMCLLAVLVIPGAELRMPANINELLLLLALGLCGFLFQYLVTAGLSYVPPKIDGKPSTHGSSATSMIYLQIVFALFYDKVVWNTTPSSTSLLGSTVILLSALYVALAAGKSKKKDTSSQSKPGETQNTNGNHDVEDHQALPKPWKARDRSSASEGETEALLGQRRND
ncbi:DUF6 domain-containing protein [Trichophyton equinum CBS 127.97]|uniref:DUF6 domain-containing protein n=1 Tax=Trichophyton equinum (strain ATCC MYA-4606 / CBS 127.97) TaxID=559882 RepID=F2PXZ8_TRIEC|nr:DUF6 domain-containing protein [Trichophyton equinum CBS 127.97]